VSDIFYFTAIQFFQKMVILNKHIMSSRIGRAFNTFKKYATADNLRKGLKIADVGVGLTRAFQNHPGALGNIARKVPTKNLDTIDSVLGVAKKIDHTYTTRIANKGHPGTDYSTGKPVAVLNPTQKQLPYATTPFPEGTTSRIGLKRLVLEPKSYFKAKRSRGMSAVRTLPVEPYPDLARDNADAETIANAIA
jgi:hypothetical protein